MRHAIRGVLIVFAGSCLAVHAAQVPLFFVEDPGVRAGSERYVTRTAEMAATFSASGVLLKVAGGKARLYFPGSNPNVRIEAAKPLSGHVNFLLGGDPAHWKTNLPTFGAMIYRELYPGVDMTYSYAAGRLKSEFTVAPEADASCIHLRYDGLEARIGEGGALLLSGAGGDLREEPPVLYQEAAGKRIPVRGSFRVLADGSVSFDIGEYDRSLPLIIDPVLTASTYLGGSGQNSATGVAVDAAGNIYAAGWTDAANFPTANALRAQSAGSVNAFVAKFSPGGNSLIYCTYLGGNGDDRAFALTVDSAGNAYVTGWTSSSNFPVAVPLQASRAGGRDAFVAKLNPSGSALVYSTFLGGNAQDAGYGIAVDGAGNAFVTGDTTSSNFPTISAYQNSNRGAQNAFIAKVSPAGGSLLFSTYLGGNGVDHAAGIAIDGTGHAYITGSTTSTNFPTAAAVQGASGGGQDAFVAKLGTSGNTLVYSTYLGGSGGSAASPEGGQGIAVDGAGSAYIAGITSSTNFPVTSGVLQPASAGGGLDAFVTKINAAGSAWTYSTYLGGSSIDCANGIAVDFLGNAYVVGYTGSMDFYTARPSQAGNAGLYDVFLSKVNPSGTALAFSTYLGGSGTDSANAVNVDALGNAYVAGLSLSSDFPLKNPVQSINTSGYAALLAKISPGWKAAVFTGGTWFVDENRNGSFDSTAAGDIILSFGQTGDLPVNGDWSGSGSQKIGVFRSGQWLLDYNGNGVWDGAAGGDRLYTFGQAGDLPVTGDWTGSGTTKIGVYRAGNWMLDTNGNGQWDNTAGGDTNFWLGNAEYLPVAGDWNGSGTSKAGVFSRGWWYLDVNGDGQWTAGIDSVFFFGASGDVPITGDWNGSGLTNIGVFRSGFWILDMNGNGQIDGIGVGEAGFWLGNSAYTPVVMR